MELAEGAMRPPNSLWNRVYRRVRDEFFPPIHPFDQTTGADTSGRLDLRRLAIGSPSRKHGRDYQGVEPGRFSDALSEIHEDFSTFTFIDLGAGKGRALLLAAQWNFRCIVGVEFSPKLAAIAQTNLGKLNLRMAEVVVHDAGDFRFPLEPLLVFMNNPFGPEILERVLGNLQAHPGPLYLAYVHALHDQTICNHGSLHPLVRGKFHSIWYRGTSPRANNLPPRQ